MSWPFETGRPNVARAGVCVSKPVMLRRTVRANLAYPLELMGTARPIIRQKVEHWAERIGLVNALERHAP